MKKKLLNYLLVSLVFAGCSQDEILQPDNHENNTTVAKVQSPNLKAIGNYLSRGKRVLSRNADEVLMPYVVDGDTVMFIANYGDGWEVFSNDTRQPMTLMKSETGSFYPTALDNQSPFEQFFQMTAQRLSQLKKAGISENDTINNEWLAYGIMPLDDNWREPGQGGDEDKYDWFWAATTVDTHEEQTLTPVGGRLTTEWDQENNFNLYTPYRIDSLDQHAAAGCVAIALGQFFYHSNKYFGYPESVPTTATYNSATNTYSFSDFSTEVWEKINNGPSFINNPTTMHFTAALIGWIGKSVNMNYGLYGEGSGASLKGTTLSFFKSQTGLNATCESFSLYKCNEVLAKGYSVIAGLVDSRFGGHAVVIDYYHGESGGYDVFYVYKKIHDHDSDVDETPEFSDSPTFEELAEIFGEENVRVEPHHYCSYYYKINWGWDGKYNNISVNAVGGIWDTPNGYNFSPNEMLYF